MKNKIETRDVNFWYGDFHALKGISMDIEAVSYTHLTILVCFAFLSHLVQA